MPASKLTPEECDWAKAVYKSLHLNFPAADNESDDAQPHAANANKANGNGVRAQAEPDLSDYVVIDEPLADDDEHRPSPIHRVMADIGLPETDEFRNRLDNYHSKFNAYQKDPVEAAHSDPEAMHWKERLVDGLGQPEEVAERMMIEQFRQNMKHESRQIAKDILVDQSDDKRFTKFLKATSENSKPLSRAHAETVIFLSQNLRTLGEEITDSTNELFQQHNFGKNMTDLIEEARMNAITPENIAKLDAFEQEVAEYRMGVARQLGMSLNVKNDVLSTSSFGDTVESTINELLDESGKANAATAGVNKLANKLVRKHLAKSNSASATLKWATQQPWSKLLKVTINTNGGYFDVFTDPYKSGDAPAFGSVYIHEDFEKGDLKADPDMIFHGLRSPEMTDALTVKPIGEPGQDGIPTVEKPSELSLEWGSALKEAYDAGEDIGSQLPDYLTVKQVRYQEVKKGFFSSTKVDKVAWVVEQKPISESVKEVNLLKQLPHTIADDLHNLCENISDLKKDQEENLAKIEAQKRKLQDFMNSNGEGLFKPYGKAHDAVSALQKHALAETTKKFQNSSDLKSVLKWVKEQPWSAMFDVKITPSATSGYDILVEDKQHEEVEDLKTTGFDPTQKSKDDGDIITVERDESDPAYGDNIKGINGALRALLKPSVYKHLTSKPTVEPAINGIPIVEEPSKLALDWAELMLKSNGGSSNLPDFLEIREVQYRQKSYLPWKRNKLKVCKVLEFNHSAFEKSQRGH